MNTKKTLALLVLLTAIIAIPAMAKELSVGEKLNKDIKISLNDVMITEALDKISKEIDVPIRISGEAEWKLPYGRSTRLSVTLKGPASESLTQMLNEFFMRYAMGADEIVIYPRPELDHIIGRPSTRQLQVLKALYTNPITLYITDNVSATINTALGQDVFVSPIEDVQECLNDSFRMLIGEKDIQFGKNEQGEPIYESLLPPDDDGDELKEYPLPTPVTVPQLLRSIEMRDNPAEWHIPAIDLPNQIPEIQVVHYSKMKELRQSQLIDISFEDQSLLDIFQSLSNRAGLEFAKHKEALQDLEEKWTISMHNVTARQAMGKIANMAKFSYSHRGNSFIIVDKVQPQKPRAPKPAATGTMMMPASSRSSISSRSSSKDSGPYVGKISIPMDGGKYYIEYMLRESDLTDELKKLRSEKIKEIIGVPKKPARPKAPAKQP